MPRRSRNTESQNPVEEREQQAQTAAVSEEHVAENRSTAEAVQGEETTVALETGETASPEQTTEEVASGQTSGEGTPEQTTEEAASGQTSGQGTPEQTTEGAASEQTSGEGTPEQAAGEGTSEQVQESGLPAEDGQNQGPLPALEVRIHEQYFQDGIRATADVKIGDICSIRNVKITEGDYGLEVVMPRTKLPESGRFKDACYFNSAEAREQFNAAVLSAYQHVMEPVTNTEAHEQYGDDMDYDEEMTEGIGGMNF